MSETLADFRQMIAEWLRVYLADERNRRDAQSALTSFVTFWVFLYIASHGVMPSYMMIDRPGRTMAIHFTPSPEVAMADLAQTRLRTAQSAPAVAQKRPPHSEQPRRLESLSSMAASRPDYFGKQAILPPVRPDRPIVSDAPAQWQEKPAPQRQISERNISGSASVQLPSAKLGTLSGKGEPTSEISFDVPVEGGSTGSDFITLSSRTLPSSVGRPGGKEMSISRPILRKTMPVVPEWFERKGLDSFVTIRIVISASGKVESAEVEKTCGYKEIDADARAAVLQWLFEPTGYRESIVVKLNYRLR